MIIESMEGSDRELLTESLGKLERRTTAAIGTCRGSFLPTTAAEAQVERIQKVKGSIPPFDDADHDIEIVDTGLCRNALVVHIRVLDATVRKVESKEKVSTRECDAKIEQLHKILRTLGDERDLDTILERIGNAETAVDENQLDFTTDGAASEGQG